MSIGGMGILNSRKSTIIGVIAEDLSDVEVASEIFAKYVSPSSFSVKKFVGNGCGRLKNKCRVWTETLFRRGCKFVIILHDRDRNALNLLRESLESRVDLTRHPNAVVVIPVEELEAWLLSDELAIQKALSLDKAPRRVANCEDISSPKEKIAEIVHRIGKKRYLNTIHNKKIARYVTIENLRRCNSFVKLDNFLCKQVFVGS